MSIRLIAVDMDGTLLDSQKRCPDDFFPFVKEHEDIKVVISSGRQYYKLYDQFEEAADKVVFVAENGAAVFYHDELIYSDSMKAEDAKVCLDIASKIPNTEIIMCGIDSAYMLPDCEELPSEWSKYYSRMEFVDNLEDAIKKDRILKIAVFIRGHKAQEAYDNFPQMPEGIESVLSGDSWVDIGNASVNKGKGIEILQERFGINREESMAFGDYLNDLSMLRQCEESWAMVSGHEIVKKEAKHITEFGNDDNGVMRTLRQIL